MPSANLALLAAAGAGKTYRIVKYVGQQPHKRFAVLTFTITNQQRLVSAFWEQWGGLHAGVRVRGWFAFLLEDLVRPYQTLLPWPQAVAKGLHWVEGRSSTRPGKRSQHYWFDKTGRVYSDKMSGLALLCDERSHGAVMRRLRLRYDRVVIDEVQDLAGYDLQLVERMLSSGVNVTMVGDPRQGSVPTNHSPKDRKYRGEAIERKIREWEDRELLRVEHQNESRRCVQSICRVADLVFPHYPATVSISQRTSNHDGVYIVRRSDVDRYRSMFTPQVLHDSRKAGGELQGMNFGECKGMDFERVLIVPTGPIARWLKTGALAKVKDGIPRARLYVAITRAKQSVAFVYDGPIGLGDHVLLWTPV